MSKLQLEAASFITADPAGGWQVLGCYIDGCGKNGLYVAETNPTLIRTNVLPGNCTGLLTRNNLEWGVKEASKYGNLYFGCIANQNTVGSYIVGAILQQHDSDALIQNGGNSNGTMFIASHFGHENNNTLTTINLPDFSNAPGVTVYGGSLSNDIIRWVGGANPNHRIGSYKRSGSDWCKEHFQENLLVTDPSLPNADARGMQVFIPELDSRDAMIFSYQPPQSSREVFDKAAYEANPSKSPSGYWVTENILSEWQLQRGNKDLLEGVPEIGNPNPYVYQPDSNLYDRTWKICSETGYANYSHYITPYGWTDRQHPLGPGHFFFGQSIANQKNYFSWKHEIKLLTNFLVPGVNRIQPLDDSVLLPELVPIKVWWLENGALNKNNLIVNITIEQANAGITGDADLIYISGYFLDPAAGDLIVKIINPTANTIDTTGLLLNIHIEGFELWPDDRYKKTLS